MSSNFASKIAHSAGKVSLTSDSQNNVIYSGGNDTLIHCLSSESMKTYDWDHSITALGFYNNSLILGDSEGKVYSINNLETKEKSLVASLTGEVTCISVRENLIAISGEQSSPLIVADNSIKTLEPGHNGGVMSVSISPNLAYLSSMGYDGKLKIFDTQTKENVYALDVVRPLKGATQQMLQGDWSPDSSSYAIPGDMVFSFICLKNGSWKYEPTKIVCNNNISIIKWPFPNTLVTASLEKKIRIWNIEKSKCLQIIDSPEMPCSLLIFNRNLIAASFDGKVEVYNNVEWGIKEIEEKEATIEVSEGKNADDKEEDENKYFFQRAIGAFPQEPIASAITDTSYAILFWSLSGKIVSKEFFTAEGVHNSVIEITFSEISFHKNLFFSNDYNLVLATMGKSGALLGSKSAEEEVDDGFIAEDSTHQRPRLVFKSFLEDHDWVIALPWRENPESLVVGNTWCAAVTSLIYLRIFSIEGIQTHIISLPLPIVSLASYENQFAMVYHSGPPVLGCQTLRCEIWQMNTLVTENEPETFVKEEISIGLSPDESLQWFGYSESGLLCTVDSGCVVRGLWRRTGHWTPLCEVLDFNRIVGVSNNEIVGVNRESELLETKPFKIPVCQNKTSELEEESILSKFNLDHDRIETEVSEKNFLEIDKLALKGMQIAAESGDYIKAVGYTKLLVTKKSKAIAYTFANKFATQLKIPFFLKKVLAALGYEQEQKEVIRKESKPVVAEPVNPVSFTPKQPEIQATPQPTMQEAPIPFTKSKTENMNFFESLDAQQPLKRKIEPESSSTKKRKLQKSGEN
ncbi:WDHD1 [Blepharisma stoltei]|uniref:WDHD1/CFT4 second beta-propeller domain-containing protein n=1 Tax=Blepharisma stoltei TaxID=1481888 RepID=A0AAU9KBK9_9CILI|nr:unnamed protein product [Blepharisma stoltei]